MDPTIIIAAAIGSVAPTIIAAGMYQTGRETTAAAKAALAIGVETKRIGEENKAGLQIVHDVVNSRMDAALGELQAQKVRITDLEDMLRRQALEDSSTSGVREEVSKMDARAIVAREDAEKVMAASAASPENSPTAWIESAINKPVPSTTSPSPSPLDPPKEQ